EADAGWSRHRQEPVRDGGTNPRRPRAGNHDLQMMHHRELMEHIRCAELEICGAKLHDLWWIVIVVAEANPCGPHSDIDESRPLRTIRSIRKGSVVNALQALELRAARLVCHALVLNGAFVAGVEATDHEGHPMVSP